VPDLRPFRGLRYSERAGSLADLVAPPYDVIDHEQHQALCRRSPYNIVRLTLDKGYSRDVLPPQAWYGEAARMLASWRAEGLLAADPRPAYYLYAQSFEHRGRRLRRKLLLGALRLEAYGSGRVLPHENTTPGPKASRLRLMQACKANLSPILAFFPDAAGEVNRALDEIAARPPKIAFADDAGIGHELWLVEDPSHQVALARAVADRPLYIADGHHRYETALAYRDAERAKLGPGAPAELPLDFVLAACMSSADPGFVIRPTHRVVRWRPGLGASELLDQARRWFDVRPLGERRLSQAMAVLDARRDEPLFIVYGGKATGYLAMRLRDDDALRHAPFGPGSPLRRLPAAVLTYGLLGRLEELRAATVAYTADAERAVREADTQERTLACLLPGVRPAELIAVVNKGERMPPKSTYFWPKPMTGMVLRSLDTL